MTPDSQPVLVVGGRTTGMFMAAELTRHGIPVRIIDKSPGIDPHSRATYMRARTLEILDGLGLADTIINDGQALNAVCIYANGKHVVTTPELAVDSPFPRGRAYAQSKTEVIFERNLDRVGVKVERSTELVDFQQTPDHVVAKIRHHDGSEETMQTPWVIGCDGSHSITRKLLEETFPGEMDPVPYLGCDVLAEGPLDPAFVYLCLHDEGDLFIFLLDEGRRQISATLPRDRSRKEPPTLEEMQRLVDERGFTDIKLSDSRWMTIFHTHYRLVPRYRHGRVFLAGDAAHVQSFVGGQGMNTGIQDAHNLAWKLAMVMQQGAPSWWLDSYESERRGIAADVLKWTKAATEELTAYADLGPQERERLLQHMVMPESERIKQRTHEEEIDLDYGLSPLCLEPSQVDTGPRAGARAPDISPIMVNGEATSLHKLLSAPRFHLLLFAESSGDDSEPELAACVQAANEQHSSWLNVHIVVGSESAGQTLVGNANEIVDPSGALRNRYGGDSIRLYLIRPDGYVAYRSEAMDGLSDYWSHVHFR